MLSLIALNAGQRGCILKKSQILSPLPYFCSPLLSFLTIIRLQQLLQAWFNDVQLVLKPSSQLWFKTWEFLDLLHVFGEYPSAQGCNRLLRIYQCQCDRHMWTQALYQRIFAHWQVWWMMEMLPYAHLISQSGVISDLTSQASFLALSVRRPSPSILNLSN